MKIARGKYETYLGWRVFLTFKMPSSQPRNFSPSEELPQEKYGFSPLMV
jgi:hypothetical protein